MDEFIVKLKVQANNIFEVKDSFEIKDLSEIVSIEKFEDFGMGESNDD